MHAPLELKPLAQEVQLVAVPQQVAHVASHEVQVVPLRNDPAGQFEVQTPLTVATGQVV